MNETYISNFIEQQFPEFYRDEGPQFIEFVKTYYEFLEQEDQEIYQTRRFLDLNDIDTTVDDFITHFLKKYLHGIPQATLLNKRELVKHIQDVYRAKGSERGFKLLFRLLYNEDLDFYIPGEDILKPSAGTWYNPKYIQVAYTDKLSTYVGNRIYGTSSNTSAIIESVISEPYNQNIITTVYLSNIVPRNSEFIVGEKIALESEINMVSVLDSPTVIGCLDSIEIDSGGQDFVEGNILRIVEKDVFTGEYLTKGKGGEVRVMKVSKGIGAIRYDIKKMGSGYNTSPAIIQYKGEGDTTGKNASFQIGALSNMSYITYNSDLIWDYRNTILGLTNYNMPGTLYSNVGTGLIDSLTFVTEPRGSITTVTNTFAGNSYTKELEIYVRSPIFGKPLNTTVVYSANATTVTCANTSELGFIAEGTTIKLFDDTNVEFHVVANVNNTTINLEGPTQAASNANTKISFGFNLYEANWPGSKLDFDGTEKSNNAVITGIPAIGNGVIQVVRATESGKGYNNNEEVTMYLYGAITKPNIIDGGRKYSNNDILQFEGGGTNSKANGVVITNSNGTITDCIMYSYGSAYQSVPSVTVKTRRGAGAHLESDMGDFNTFSKVKGRVKLAGMGYERGRWLNTQSFLNSDKKLQDSYFYQDFSYQLKTAVSMDKYKELLMNIYHISGWEMFGTYQNIKNESLNLKISKEEMSIT